MDKNIFRDICRRNYELQLAEANLPPKVLLQKLQDEDAFFDKSEICGLYEPDFKGGALVIISDKTAYIFYILILEEFRGQGWGKKLLNDMEEKFKGLGIERIQLNVFNHNKSALKLYKDFTVVSSFLEKVL